MQPVWVLSVDLQTKTATFQTGLSEAARAARGHFNDIRGGASQMGGAVSYSMSEARHSVMLLGEEFGVHLPRGVTTFLASLGPIGPALEAAFPFLAIAVGATLLIEHLVKMSEAGQKLTEDQLKFGTAAQTAWNQLDEKILQAQLRADELKGDHLAALKTQLELIDKQSMDELVHSFEEVAKAADVVMKDLEGSWYTFDTGSDGANHALQQFRAQYENLLAQGKDKEASDLLKGTRDTALELLTAQQTLKSGNWGPAKQGGVWDESNPANAESIRKLKAANLDITDKNIAAQQQLVDALNTQLGVEQRIAELKKLESGNATRTTGNEMASQAADAQKQSAQSMLRMGQEVLAADRANADAQLTIHRATVEQRLASDLDFAARDRDLQLAANAQEIAALDKSGKDYQNQLKALNEKALEIQQQYDTTAAELRAKASVESYNRDLAAFEGTEREKISATDSGSKARLAAIDAAIKEEESRNLQDTEFYRDLLKQRAEAARQEAEEEGKLQEEAGREEAENILKTGELALAARKQQIALEDSTRRVSDQTRMQQDISVANQEYQMKLAALQREIAALDKSGKDYNNKLKALQDQEKQLTQQHENDITAIKEKAEQERNDRILAAETRLNDDIARQLTQSLMRHQSWSKMVVSLGDEVVSGMIQNAIKSMLADDMTKERDAAAAARKGFNAGMSFPFPVNIVMAPVLAAGAFASVMAFQSGTEGVPGVGTGDVVPALLEPGEGVVPKGVMEGLRNMANSGGFNGGNTTHVHVRPTYHVQTIDGDGMKAALEKHTDQLQRHFEQTVRRMNR